MANNFIYQKNLLCAHNFLLVSRKKAHIISNIFSDYILHILQYTYKIMIIQSICTTTTFNEKTTLYDLNIQEYRVYPFNIKINIQQIKYK